MAKKETQKQTDVWLEELAAKAVRLSGQSPETNGFLTKRQMFERLRAIPGNEGLTKKALSQLLISADADGRLEGGRIQVRIPGGFYTSVIAYRLKPAK